MILPRHAARAVGTLALATLAACSSTPTRTTPAPSPDAEFVNAGSSLAVVLSPEEAAARLAKLSTPGPEHAELMARAGTWSVESRYRMGPDQPWGTTQGTIRAKTVLGGRFLLEEQALEMSGVTMEGMLFLGFDNGTQEYISLWMDTSSTWWVEARGKKGPDGVTELRGTLTDFNGTRPYRVRTWQAADGSIENELYDTIAGREVLIMAYTSRRKS